MSSKRHIKNTCHHQEKVMAYNNHTQCAATRLGRGKQRRAPGVERWLSEETAMRVLLSVVLVLVLLSGCSSTPGDAARRGGHPEQAADLPGAHLQIERVDGSLVAEALGQGGAPECRLSGHGNLVAVRRPARRGDQRRLVV